MTTGHSLRRSRSAEGSQPAAELLPDGLEPPPDIPPEIFSAALGVILGCSRLDMRSLAIQLGIGRATL